MAKQILEFKLNFSGSLDDSYKSSTSAILKDFADIGVKVSQTGKVITDNFTQMGQSFVISLQDAENQASKINKILEVLGKHRIDAKSISPSFYSSSVDTLKSQEALFADSQAKRVKEFTKTINLEKNLEKQYLDSAIKYIKDYAAIEYATDAERLTAKRKLLGTLLALQNKTLQDQGNIDKASYIKRQLAELKEYATAKEVERQKELKYVQLLANQQAVLNRAKKEAEIKQVSVAADTSTKQLKDGLALREAILKYGENSREVIMLRAAQREAAIERARVQTILGIEEQLKAGKINAATAIAKINVVNTTAGQTITNIRQQASALKEQGNIAEEVSRKNKNLLLTVFEFVGAYSIAHTALTTFISALKSVPAAGIQVQATQAALTGVFGSKDTIDNLRMLKEEALYAGQNLVQLENGYRVLAPAAALAGEKQSVINQIFRDFTETGTILHQTQDDIQGVFYAIEQMYGKGVVQSEEIKKQLGNRLPGAVEIGAKAMHMSVAEFMAAMKNNEITAKEFVPKFAALYRQIFGGVDDSVFTNIKDKFFANLQRIQAQYTLTTRDIFNKVEEDLNSIVKSGVEGLIFLRENLNGTILALKVLSTSILASSSLLAAKWIFNNGKIIASNLALAGSIKTVGNASALANKQAFLASSTNTQAATAAALAQLTTWEKIKNTISGIALFIPRLLGLNATFAGIATLGTGLAYTTAKLVGLNFEYGKFTGISRNTLAKLQSDYSNLGSPEEIRQRSAFILQQIATVEEKGNQFFITYKDKTVSLSSLVSSTLDNIGNNIKNNLTDIFDFVGINTKQISSKFVELYTASTTLISNIGKETLKDFLDLTRPIVWTVNYFKSISSASNEASMKLQSFSDINNKALLDAENAAKAYYDNIAKVPETSIKDFKTTIDNIFADAAAKDTQKVIDKIKTTINSPGQPTSSPIDDFSVEKLNEYNKTVATKQVEAFTKTLDQLKTVFEQRKTEIENLLKLNKISLPVADKLKFDAEKEYLLEKQKVEQQIANTLRQQNDTLSKQIKSATTLEQAFKAIVLTENRGKITGREGVVSPAGAMGLTQIMPGTAAQYGVDVPKQFLNATDTVSERKGGISSALKKEMSVWAAAHKDELYNASLEFFKDISNTFGNDFVKAAAAYNSGPGKKGSAHYEAINSSQFQNLHPETVEYVKIYQNYLKQVTGENAQQLDLQNKIAEAQTHSKQTVFELKQLDVERAITLKTNTEELKKQEAALKIQLLEKTGQKEQAALAQIILDKETAITEARNKGQLALIPTINRLASIAQQEIAIQSLTDKQNKARQAYEDRVQEISNYQNISSTKLKGIEADLGKLQNERLAQLEIYIAEAEKLEKLGIDNLQIEEATNLKIAARKDYYQIIADRAAAIRALDAKVAVSPYASGPQGQIPELKLEEAKNLALLNSQIDFYARKKDIDTTAMQEYLALVEKKHKTEQYYETLYNKIKLENTAMVHGQMAGDLEYVTGTMQKIYGEQSKQAKASFAFYKAAAIAQTTISTYTGAQQAYQNALAIPYIGTILAPIAAATAVAAGLARVYTIAATPLPTGGAAHGGLTNVPKEQTYLLDKGERVLSPKQNKDLTNYLGNKKETTPTASDVNVKVVNVYSEDVMKSYLSSPSGEKMIINIMKRNGY